MQAQKKKVGYSADAKATVHSESDSVSAEVSLDSESSCEENENNKLETTIIVYFGF